MAGRLVRGLLKGQRPDGGFGSHPYAKWSGSFWRVAALVELGVPEGEPRTVAAARNALAWVIGPDRFRGAGRVAGRERRHAAAEGLMLAALARLGLAGEPIAVTIAEQLATWQWPDGGWNCDPRPAARHSSFHESLWPAWGLCEYAYATGDGYPRAAALRTVDLLLAHRIFRSRRTGEVIHPSWVTLHHPPYWHYDALAALGLLARSHEPPRRPPCRGRVGASGTAPAWRWPVAAGGYWWKPPRSAGSGVEVVDWGRRGPNEMITLKALSALRAAGRV